jgi:hypothetical protein
MTLASTASGVNDFYNGASIYVLNRNTCKVESRQILDYVGSTKIATIDSAFNNVNVSDGYNINMPLDGKNYFKITGTGFSGLGLTVDFRYVYI